MNILDEALEISQKRLERHESVTRHSIMKTSIMLAVTAIVAKESLSFMPSEVLSTLDMIALAVFINTLLAILACFAFGLSIPHSRRWRQGPDLNEAIKIEIQFDADTAKQWLIEANILTEWENNARSTSIMKRFDYALYSLGVAIVGVASLVLIQTFT